jgi:hypothetical protein
LRYRVGLGKLLQKGRAGPSEFAASGIDKGRPHGIRYHSPSHKSRQDHHDAKKRSQSAVNTKTGQDERIGNSDQGQYPGQSYEQAPPLRMRRAKRHPNLHPLLDNQSNDYVDQG